MEELLSFSVVFQPSTQAKYSPFRNKEMEESRPKVTYFSGLFLTVCFLPLFSKMGINCFCHATFIMFQKSLKIAYSSALSFTRLGMLLCPSFCFPFSGGCIYPLYILSLKSMGSLKHFVPVLCSLVEWLIPFLLLGDLDLFFAVLNQINSADVTIVQTVRIHVFFSPTEHAHITVASLFINCQQYWTKALHLSKITVMTTGDWRLHIQ